MLPLTRRVVTSVWFFSVTMLMGCLPADGALLVAAREVGIFLHGAGLDADGLAADVIQGEVLRVALLYGPGGAGVEVADHVDGAEAFLVDGEGGDAEVVLRAQRGQDAGEFGRLDLYLQAQRGADRLGDVDVVADGGLAVRAEEFGRRIGGVRSDSKGAFGLDRRGYHGRQRVVLLDGAWGRSWPLALPDGDAAPGAPVSEALVQAESARAPMARTVAALSLELPTSEREICILLPFVAGGMRN